MGLRRIDEARVVRGAVTGYGAASGVLAPDDQRSDLVQLHGVRPHALARLRRRVVLDARPGTFLCAEVARAGLYVIRRGLIIEPPVFVADWLTALIERLGRRFVTP